jgi:hypothetical protein
MGLVEQEQNNRETGTMKIAQVAPLYESVPPKLYGGTERIVAYLSDALVDLGHDVTLFASADARTRHDCRRLAIRQFVSTRTPCVPTRRPT